jgi:hypothetical protein
VRKVIPFPDSAIHRTRGRVKKFVPRIWDPGRVWEKLLTSECNGNTIKSVYNADIILNLHLYLCNAMHNMFY